MVDFSCNSLAMDNFLWRWYSDTTLSNTIVIMVRLCLFYHSFGMVHLLYCIRTLPRGGMYWKIHSPRPKRFPNGCIGKYTHLGPRDFPRVGILHPSALGKSLGPRGVYFPIHPSSRQCTDTIQFLLKCVPQESESQGLDWLVNTNFVAEKRDLKKTFPKRARALPLSQSKQPSQIGKLTVFITKSGSV